MSYEVGFSGVLELVLKSATGASTCDLVLSVSSQCFLKLLYVISNCCKEEHLGILACLL